MSNFSNIFKSIGNCIDKESKVHFNNGKELGFEDGFREGLKAGFKITSELNDKENELLRTFLIRHNFVLFYCSEYGGFRVRRNDKLNPRKPVVMSIIDNEEEIGIKTVSLAEYDLIRLKKEYIYE
jgi:hypothetical protein